MRGAIGQHPELVSGAVIVSTGSLSSGGEAVRVHVRITPPSKLVLRNAEAEQFEEVDRIEPRLRSF